MENIKRKLKRFTFLELIIVIAIIGLIGVLGMPKLNEIRNSIGLKNASNLMKLMLNYNKNYALSEGKTKNITFSKTGNNYICSYSDHTGTAKEIKFSDIDFIITLDGSNTGIVTFDKAGNASSHTILIKHIQTNETKQLKINSVGAILE